MERSVEMTEKSSPLLHGWRYGVHPHAVGMQVRAIGRVELPLGEALRIELESDAPGASGMGHLQYYVATEAGAWALWLSCPPAELRDAESALEKLQYPLQEEG
jgi:hypothetical protein